MNEDTARKIGAMQAGIDSLSHRVEKINPCHEPSSGKFCSTGGGGGGGATSGIRPGETHNWDKIQARGSKSAEKKMRGLNASYNNERGREYKKNLIYSLDGGKRNWLVKKPNGRHVAHPVDRGRAQSFSSSESAQRHIDAFG